jgi:hypothetical protein
MEIPQGEQLTAALSTLCLSVCLSMDLQPLSTLAAFFQLINLYTVGRTPWTGDKPVARPLPTHRRSQTQNKRTQISMLRVGFETTIPVLQRADGSCLRPHSHCDRPVINYFTFLSERAYIRTEPMTFKH